MKTLQRLCGAALALCLLLSQTPAGAAQAPVFALRGISVESAESVKVRVLAERDCVLAAALYDRDGSMLTAGMADVTGGGQEQEVPVPLPAGGVGYDLAKAFLLDAGTKEPLCACVSITAAEQRIAALDLPDSWKEELLRADSMGFPMERLEQATVSGREMSLLLDHLVSYAAPDKLAQWQALLPDFAAYEGPLTRFDAMAGLFLAAQTIGGRWAEPVESIYEVWNSLNGFNGIEWGLFTSGLFDDTVNCPIYIAPLYPGECNSLDVACVCYNFSRPSPVSGEFPFAYDEQANSIHEYDPLTYAEAVLAVTRLILSAGADPAGDAQPVTQLTAEKDAQLHLELQEAINAILNSKTGIICSDTAIPGETYTGAAYYVSADGDDGNDGLSPATPWRTLQKVSKEAGGWGEPGILRSGDAVFFRRGDIFRCNSYEDIIVRTPGITFSAYGEGAKPIISGSSESGLGAEKWKLVYEDQASGQKIWQFYREMRDIGCIVLNDGEIITKRVYEFWGENGYESCDCNTYLMHTDYVKGVDLKGRLYEPWESLTEDMTIISRPDRGKMVDGFAGEDNPGPLYLRCDAGNPGKLFTSIEFSENEIMGLFWLGASDTVFDNLSLRSNGNSYIKVANDDAGVDWRYIQNTVVQNCELAYGGGGVAFYRLMDNGEAFPYVQGDGIYDIVCNTTIRNNYFHDCLSSATTFEVATDFDPPDGEPGRGYYYILDNVIVNTVGLRLDSSLPYLQHLDSVVIRGNHIWNTGHMDNGGYFYSEGSIKLYDSHYAEFRIEDNVFYGTENGYRNNALFDSGSINLSETIMPILANNTYVQHRGRLFMYLGWDQSEKKFWWTIDDPELMYMVRRYLRDTTSEFYVVD